MPPAFGLFFGDHDGAMFRPLGCKKQGLVIGGAYLPVMVVGLGKPGGLEVRNDFFLNKEVRNLRQIVAFLRMANDAVAQ